MITCVSLNPSIDRTLTVSGFQPGELNRVNARSDVAAGKGINVAITAARLGVETECIGFMYKDSAPLFEKRLIANGTTYDFVMCEGSARVNIKVFDTKCGVVTELNESGIGVTETQIHEMTGLLARHAENSDYIILSGSLPPGCPADYYKTLIDEVKGLDCRVILDADGERLMTGIEAAPFLIKPNRFEMETLIGEKLNTLEDVKNAALRFIDCGVQVVVVTLGAQGSLITNGSHTLFASGLKLDVKSTVGAGDAMAAGLAAGFMGEATMEETFRMGVAMASARCATDAKKAVDKQLYKDMLGLIEIHEL